MSFSSSWKLFVVSCAATIITVAAAVALSYQLMDRKAYKKLKKVKKKDGTINIGGT